MIVSIDGNRLRCVTQCDHAALAAEMLSLWRGDGLPDNSRRDALLRAVREHDNGWQEIDAAPLVDKTTGAPLDFLSVPDAERFDLWERATRSRVSRSEDPARDSVTPDLRSGAPEEEPYVALLIATHAVRLHEDRRQHPPWADFLERMEARRQVLLTTAELDEATVEADYRLLALADTLSLAFCNGWSEGFHRTGYAARLEAETLLLKPFPLAGATTFRVACRWIPRRRFNGDADLGVELATSRWESTPVRLAPG